MKKAYLIHGTSTRDDDWFPWLEKAARPAIELDRLWLPDPFAPQQVAWDQAVDDQIKAEDGITLVAHSLGCITAVRWLARHDVKNVGLLLVGAFDQPLPNYAGLDEFMQGSVDYRQVRPKISRATVIAAQNDPIAPYQFGVAMANRLGAKLIVRPDGGHFLTSDGFTEFPLALTELKRVAGVD